MKVFLVGGAVRDKLLGIPPQDFDYVVIDSSEEELLKLGYQKVGVQFPVFLHPQTREEYALPRGKDLVEDLSNRDLTINAMAIDENGVVIDPFDGREDLKLKVLRHVSSSFSDDPLRVFRLFRFKTIYPHFKVAPETSALVDRVIHTQRFELIAPERILQELKIVLASERASAFFQDLKEANALDGYFKELKELSEEAWNALMRFLDQASLQKKDLLVRYALLARGSGFKKLPVSNEWSEAALAVGRLTGQESPEEVVQLLYDVDAFRKPDLVRVLQDVIDVRGEKLELESGYEAIKDISVESVPANLTGRDIGEAIKAERIRVLSASGLFTSRET